MKILHAATPDTHPVPAVISAVRFAPWPFSDDAVRVRDVRLIGSTGDLSDVVPSDTIHETWPTLVELSDGSRAIAHSGWNPSISLFWDDEASLA